MLKDMVKDELNNNKVLESTLYTLLDNDPETTIHSNRVRQLCKLLGLAMGLPYEELCKLEVSGMFHDIGKISVSKKILNEPGPLTDKEWNEVKKHPEFGYLILANSIGLRNISEIVLYHHERYDGSGYPAGLKGKEIPLLSRILAVVDSYDAMISLRPYKEKISKNMAVLELMKNKEKQFDPMVVDIFIEKVLGENTFSRKYISGITNSLSNAEKRFFIKTY